MKKLLTVCVALMLLAIPVSATVVDHVGSGHAWTTSWNALTGLNDPNDGKGACDYVGDANNTIAYWSDNGTYLYFRMRIATGTVSAQGALNNSYFLLVNVRGYNVPASKGSNTNGVLPDFAFSWDAKSNDNSKHGLEMQVLNQKANTWNGINFEDIDTNAAVKAANDINGGGRTTDGYVRTVDQQSTTNFGMTTFIDLAVSWAYLTNYTGLAKGQTWDIGLASIANATDHNNLGDDIAGGATPTSQTTAGWATIPEPTVVSLLSAACFFTLIFRRLLPERLRRAITGR